MITNATKNRACDFLLKIADQERHAEKHRQILCDNVTFEPYSAFRRICGPVKSGISVEDIQQFLADNRTFKSFSSIEKFVRHYSESSAPRLEYREFLRVVLPMSESTIRAQASQRPIYSDTIARLSPSVEACLCDVIAYEVDFFDNLYLYFQDMATRGDYSPIDLYHEIKTGFESQINFHHLRRFFVHQGIVPFDHEVIEILRRLDKDDDGTVNLRELEEFLRMVDSAFARAGRDGAEDRFEKETTITRTATGREVDREIITKTVTKDDFVRERSPLTKSQSYRSIRKSYGHRPLHTTYTHTARPTHVHSHTHLHDRHAHVSPRVHVDPCHTACHAGCHDVCAHTCHTGHHHAGCCEDPCHDTCHSHSKREIIVESALPKRSTSRSYRTIRRSISRGKEDFVRSEPQINYRTTIRRSVSRDRDNFIRADPGVSFRTTTINKTISRDREDDQFSRPREPLGRVRRNREDTQYTSWVNGGGEGRRESGYGRQEEVASPNSHRSLRQGGVDQRANKHFASTQSIKMNSSFDIISDFITYLRYVARLESELNVLKQELCTRTDYSSLDLFRCVDSQGKGHVNEADLGLFLRDIDPSITSDQITYIFRKLDADEDGTVSYSDFINLVIPIEPHYEQMVKERVSRNNRNQFTFFELFSYRTRDCIKAIFQLAAKNESQLASLKSGILCHRDQLFEQLDARATGRIDDGQLLRFCEKHGLPLNSSELEVIFRRLDKNGDNLITYNDFLREMQH